jgi:prevent-host-death family protein
MLVMIKVNVHEAKTHLSRYLDRVEAGETVTLCRNNKPIAEIRPIPKKPWRKPIWGMDKGKFELGPEFFEPLPDELLRAFNGEND